MIIRKTDEFVLTKKDVQKAILQYIEKKSGKVLDLEHDNISWEYKDKSRAGAGPSIPNETKIRRTKDRLAREED